MITAGLGGLAPASLGETLKKGGPGGASPPFPLVLPPQKTALLCVFQEAIIAIVLTHKTRNPSPFYRVPEAPSWVDRETLIRQLCFREGTNLPTLQKDSLPPGPSEHSHRTCWQI